MGSLAPLLLLLFGVLSSGTIAQNVTWTWTDHEITTRFSYRLVKKLLNWNEAKEFCALRGGQLAQPDSQAKNENIKANLPSNDPTQTWFGARKVNNQWQYTDGSTLLFTNWNQGSPSGDGSCTTYLGRARPWNDAPCGNKYHFICENSKDSRSQNGSRRWRRSVWSGHGNRHRFCPRCFRNTSRGCKMISSCRKKQIQRLRQKTTSTTPAPAPEIGSLSAGRSDSSSRKCGRCYRNTRRGCLWISGCY